MMNNKILLSLLFFTASVAQASAPAAGHIDPFAGYGEGLEAAQLVGRPWDERLKHSVFKGIDRGVMYTVAGAMQNGFGKELAAGIRFVCTPLFVVASMLRTIKNAAWRAATDSKGLEFRWLLGTQKLFDVMIYNSLIKVADAAGHVRRAPGVRAPAADGAIDLAVKERHTANVQELAHRIELTVQKLELAKPYYAAQVPNLPLAGTAQTLAFAGTAQDASEIYDDINTLINQLNTLKDVCDQVATNQTELRDQKSIAIEPLRAQISAIFDKLMEQVDPAAFEAKNVRKSAGNNPMAGMGGLA